MFDFEVKSGLVKVKPYDGKFRFEDGRIVLLIEEARDLSHGLRMAATWPVEQLDDEDA